MAAHLYGMHDWDEEWGRVVRDAGVTAWAVPTFAVSEELSYDFTQMAQYGVTPLARLNWGYGSTGTIPLPAQYDQFAQRCAEFVAGSRGCRHWIVGNEPNHPQEWPNGQPILPEMYVDCYRRAYGAIKSAQPDAVIIPAPAAPWTDRVGVGWLEYFRRVLEVVECGAIGIHTYSRGPQPSTISDETRMGSPYQAYRSGFRAYRDFLGAVPARHRALPVHITEFDENAPWLNQNTGVVQAAYAEIDAWNRVQGTQKVHSLVLFRWAAFDQQWRIAGKQGVIDDWRQAMQRRYEIPGASSQPGGSSVYIPVVSAPGGGDQPTPLEWDPRLDQRGVKIEPAVVQAGQAYWRVARGQWFNEQEADHIGPDHHILIDVLDEHGARAVGVPLAVNWPNGTHRLVTEEKRGEPWSANYPMSKSLNEFSVRVMDGPSDTVTGIGMGADGNSGIHTSTLLVFQRAQKGATGTVTTPQPPAKAKVPPLVHPLATEKAPVVTQRFGDRPDYYKQFLVDEVPLRGHNGIDFGVPVGTIVTAVDAGRVVENANEGSKGYGKYVKLSHAWGESLYAHLNDAYVAVGDMVKAGQTIGRSGNTGNSSGPHLHFGLRVAPFNRRDGMGGYTDPGPFLRSTVATGPGPTTGTRRADVWEMIQSTASEFGVDRFLLASLTWAESSWRPDVVSSAGARGLGQLMPGTWDEWAGKVGAVDPFNPQDNLRVTAAYLAWLLKAAGNEWAALHAYVWGIGNVLAGRKPPDEVTDYATKIIHGRDLLKAVLLG